MKKIQCFCLFCNFFFLHIEMNTFGAFQLISSLTIELILCNKIIDITMYTIKYYMTIITLVIQFIFKHLAQLLTTLCIPLVFFHNRTSIFMNKLLQSNLSSRPVSISIFVFHRAQYFTATTARWTTWGNCRIRTLPWTGGSFWSDLGK